MQAHDGIQCMFTCKFCGLVKAPFTVRWREQGEDVVEWIEKAVRPAMGKAHLALSPMCRAPHADLMLPMSEGSAGIGMRTIN